MQKSIYSSRNINQESRGNQKNQRCNNMNNMSRLNIPITEVKASSSFFTESFIDIFVIQQIDCKFQTTSDKRGKEKETERNNFKNKSFFATSISTSPSLKIKINV